MNKDIEKKTAEAVFFIELCDYLVTEFQIA